MNQLNSIKASEYHKKNEYSGVVIDKFTDSLNHNSKTIMINKNGIDKGVLFHFEIGGMFEYIDVGDTISQKLGTTTVVIKRKDFDTIVDMEINDSIRSIFFR